MIKDYQYKLSNNYTNKLRDNQPEYLGIYKPKPNVFKIGEHLLSNYFDDPIYFLKCLLVKSTEITARKEPSAYNYF
jgi:hypothetical protein